MKLKPLHYSWVMVLIAACVLGTHALLHYTFGIFLRPLTIQFGWERGALSLAWSMTWVVGGLLGIVAGKLTDKYGPRLLATAASVSAGTAFFLMSQISSLWQVYLIFGLLMSIANGCLYIPVTSTIPRWFTRMRGTAMGIAVAGFGLGGIIAPVLTQWLISSYGWRQAYIVLGLITLVIITPLAQFMKHSPQRMGLKPYGENRTVETAGEEHPLISVAEGLSFTQAIRTGRFWIFGLILFSFLFSLQAVVVHISPHAVDIGISEAIAASVLSIIAGGSIIGKTLAGFVSDKIGARLTLTTYLVILTLSMIWLLFTRETWMLCLFAVVFGIAYGGIVPLQNLIPAELFGIKFLGIIMATVMFCSTIGGAIGAPLTGYIFDVTGSYRLAFLICLILCTLSIVLSLILLRSRGKESIAVTA